ncbi:hypothetical protein CAG54_11105 [Vibrio sp. V27_P1S3P104]|uniref:hypothetical protein n=1 Tax=unclassified Vibrio TaxID=2614977 RepID=UPI0013734224|nr:MULTISPECIES: hypothetical protein [unclassified Vibrio]NAX35478.1 hypothetical protein [Vibrio sp. V29_P1S30P107]NAX38044.1 hypothetical protein [Vibrio sp. V27_P1S3P104]
MSDSTNPTKYNFPYRTNYEAYLLVTWTAAAIVLFVLPFIVSVPMEMYLLASLTCLLIGLVTGHKAFEIYIRKKRLKGYPLEFIELTDKKVLEMFGIDKKVIADVQRNRKK